MTAGRTRLVDLVARLRSAHVLVIGDLMLDRFVQGTVDRISPEAPIPVLKITSETRMLGGAGNVVRNLAALGAEVSVLGQVGADAVGDEIAALLAESTDGAVHLVRDASRPTTVKTRFLAGGQQVLRADAEDVAPLSAPHSDELLARADRMLAEASVIILSDYGKGVLDATSTPALIAAARAKGVVVIVDPKGEDFGKYRGASLLTPNLKELALASGRAVAGDAAVVGAATRVIESAGIDALLVTRSSDGMTLVTRTGEIHHQAAEAREVFDVSGAGDTVVAALAAAVSAGAPLADAVALANVAAGIVVGKVGTAVAHADDIVHELHRQDLAAAEDKVLNLEPLKDRVAVWRRQGLTIGFTNGCFDLLHPGHVSLLAQARAACDRLIVGLNSDASVTRLKGESRPIQGEAARAQVLGSLAAVDAVVLFGEDTPLELIAALRPDVLVKGAEYSVDQVVGADLVQRAGGKVILAELVPGHSTTKTIEKLR